MGRLLRLATVRRLVGQLWLHNSLMTMPRVLDPRGHRQPFLLALGPDLVSLGKSDLDLQGYSVSAGIGVPAQRTLPNRVAESSPHRAGLQGRTALHVLQA